MLQLGGRGQNLLCLSAGRQKARVNLEINCQFSTKLPEEVDESKKLHNVIAGGWRQELLAAET